MTETELQKHKQDALAIRRLLIQMHFEASSGHIGTGLSAIDLLTYLYKSFLGKDDQFVLSKGHGASSLYATLHHFGILSAEDLATYYKDGTLLPAHPAPNAWDAIPAATGSLGHGLSIATGIAYAEKNLNKSSKKTVCLLSDGECNEGSVWEAALFGSHHQLANLTVIVDANGLQGFGKSKDVLNMEPFTGKWRAFGFDVREIDGHDFAQIDQAIKAPRGSSPVCVLARTVKGKGVSYMEDRMEWHYNPMKKEHFEKALADLDAALSGVTS